MTLTLLVKKLELENDKFVTSSILKGYCTILKLDYYTAIRYLTHNEYLITLLKGIFYIKSVEERKHKKTDINYIDAIKKALELKKVKNWYFGLDTAVRMNNLSHEYSEITYIINDLIFRKNPVTILGHKVKFIKISKSLFGFGIKNNVADTERTVLDTIYLGKYNGASDNEIKNRISSLLGYCKKKKLTDYAKHYPKTVIKLGGEII